MVTQPERKDGTAEIEVSVIVPVRDRRAMLDQLLDGLEKQTFRSFEVIVIDDGSSDGSDELARRAVVAGRPVRVLQAGGRGALAARRQGVACAQGALLAFTDSDCVPDVAWLEHGVAAIRDGAEMVNGYTRPMRPLRPLERSMASGTEGLYPTCNMFYTQALYQRLGGFDAGAASRWRFRLTRRARGLGFGEDTLLGWLAVRSGADTRYVPEAIVEHQVFPPDLGDFLSRVAQVAAFPAMVKEVPELRRTLLWHRVFLGHNTRGPVYAALIALGLRRPRLTVVVLVWWTLSRLRVLRSSPLPISVMLPWLPVELAVDVVTAAALVAGSIRSGSVVL